MIKQIESTSANRFKLLGIALLIIGLVAIVFPIAFGEGLVWVIGILLIVGGCFQALQGFRAEGSNDKVYNLLMGLLTVVIGLVIASHGIFTLTLLSLLIGFIFLIEGVWKMMVAFAAKQADGWVLLLVSGILSLVLALLIFFGWPESSVKIVGILIGVNLCFTGIAMIALGSTLRKVEAVVAGAQESAPAAEASPAAEESASSESAPENQGGS